MRLSVVLMIGLVLAPGLEAQVKQRRSELNRLVPPASRISAMQQEKAAKLFERVKDGLAEVSAEKVSRVFDRSIHLALPGVEPGQFSRDQASQLVASYLLPVQTIAVEVKKKEDTLASPYYSAVLRIRTDGQEQELNLYVSLVRSGDDWAVGHFSIY